jgi:transcription elongation factor GreB
MPDLRIVDSVPADRSRIFFGAWVTLSDEQNIDMAFRVVGPDELDPKRGLISMDAPLARAMMGRTVDDEVVVITPGGPKRYWILKVSYEAL